MKPQKTKPHTLRDLGLAKTMPAAAARTGFDISVVKRAQSLGCSAFRANGSIDCDELVKFVAAMPEVAPTERPDFHLEKALDMIASRKLKEQKLAERAKSLVPIESVRRGWLRNVVACKTKLYTAENSIAVEIGMKLALSTERVNQAKEIIMKHQRGAVKEMFVGEWGKVVCPDCGKEVFA